MDPSSRETTVFLRHLVIVIVWMTVWYAGWIPTWISDSSVHTRQLTIQNNKIPSLHDWLTVHHSITLVDIHWCTKLLFIYIYNFSRKLLDVYIQLNMFRASSRPSSGAQQLHLQPLVLPLERGGSSAVGRCRAGRPAGPTTNNTTATPTLQR